MKLRRAWTFTSLMVAASMLLAACGGSAPPQPTPAPAGTPTTSAASNTAVPTPPPPPTVAVASPTEAPSPTAEPSPTLAPSPTAAPSPTPSALRRTLNAAATFTDEQGHVQGDLSPFTVSVQPGPREEEFRLGFFETDVGQLGSVWRASAWMATAVGALETWTDINSLRVSWETTGRIDGPSAGGLMTVAFVSAVVGDETRTDFAFTGTINPDGSIGPVGGIVHKLDAVIEQGMKTFLIPIGQRYDTNLETGEQVDVVAKGKLAGVEVREVATFEDAYAEITGKPLPRTETSSRNPDLSSDTYDRIRPKVIQWTNEFVEAHDRYATLKPTVQEVFAEDLGFAEDTYIRAQNSMNQGDVAGAYLHIRNAAYYMNSLASVGRLYETVEATGDYDSAQTYLEQGLNAQHVFALVERLKVMQPSSPDDAILVIDSWSNTLWAAAIRTGTTNELLLARDAPDVDARWSHLFAAAWLQPRERLIEQEVEDVLDLNFGRASSGAAEIDPRALESWSGVFTRAAQANVTYFNELILDEVGRQSGLRTEVVKALFAANNFDYVVADFGASGEAEAFLDQYVGKGAASRQFAQLGFALASYIASSSLIAQFYSLDAETDDNFNVVAIHRDRALIAMLDAATQRAKERITALETSNGDTSLAVLAFQTGRAQREDPDPAEKLYALRSFWAASTYARLQVLMARPTES